MATTAVVTMQASSDSQKVSLQDNIVKDTSNTSHERYKKLVFFSNSNLE